MRFSEISANCIILERMAKLREKKPLNSRKTEAKKPVDIKKILPISTDRRLTAAGFRQLYLLYAQEK